MVVGEKPALRKNKLERLIEKTGSFFSGIAMIPGVACEFYRAVTKKDTTRTGYTAEREQSKPYDKHDNGGIII